MKQQSAYAAAGVDYTLIQDFKDAMVRAGKKTLRFPRAREVEVVRLDHGLGLSYFGRGHKYMFVNTLEGLGNKNWIAEWMYMHEGTGNSYYDIMGADVALMGANDCAAHGAMPVGMADEVTAGISQWFDDKKRAADLANGFIKICREVGMALGAGESPAYKYLVKPVLPVQAAPVMSVSVTGLVAPKTALVTRRNIRAGDAIVAAQSNGWHANGASLIITEALKLPEVFLTKIGSSTLGQIALKPVRSYVRLVEALLHAEVKVHAFLPGTGDGVAKLAVDKRDFTYRIHSWWSVDQLDELFRWFKFERGLPMEDCLKTFNWGSGYYVFVPKREVQRTIDVGTAAGYNMLEVGVVERGTRGTIFGPANNLFLPPPGE